MRKATFEVPSEVIGAFTRKLTGYELENSILGENDNAEIEVEVYYEKDQAGKVDDLEEYLEYLIEEMETGQEEDDEEEDQDEEEEQDRD